MSDMNTTMVDNNDDLNVMIQDEQLDATSIDEGNNDTMIESDDNTMIESNNMIDPEVKNIDDNISLEGVLGNSDSAPQNTTPVSPAPTVIALTSFYEYINANWNNIQGMNYQMIGASGVNPEEVVSFTLPISGEGVVDGRKMYHFNGAHLMRVPNLPIVSFSMLNERAFKMTQSIIPDTLYLKSYSAGNILFCVFYLNVNNQLIPLEKTRIKKKTDTLQMVFDVNNIDAKIKEYQEKLVTTVNKENLFVLYKQASKAINEFSTYQSVFDWFVNRCKGIIDIHHLIQIDGVLIQLFNM